MNSFRNKPRKPPGYWTLHRCLEVSNNYDSRIELYRQRPEVYAAAQARGWLPKIFPHLEPTKRWTRESCAVEAKRYSYRREFNKRASGAYDAAIRHGWLNDICGHMLPARSRGMAAIYLIKSKAERAVYVGLSCNPMQRLSDHRKNAKSGAAEILIGPHELSIVEWVRMREAPKLERDTIAAMKVAGYRVLNKARGGSVGAGIFAMTRLEVEREAKNYDHRKEFKVEAPGAYAIAWKKGWLDEVCAHMMPLIKPKHHWNKERCALEASRFNSRKTFQYGSGSAYKAARLNGWLNEICEHMRRPE